MKNYLYKSKSFYLLIIYTFICFYNTVPHINNIYFHRLGIDIDTSQLYIFTFVLFLITFIITCFNNNINLLIKMLIIKTPSLIIDNLNFMATSFYPGLMMFLTTLIILIIFIYLYCTTRRKRAINIFNLISKCIIVIEISLIITIPFQKATTYIYELYTPAAPSEKAPLPTIDNQSKILENLAYKKWPTLNISDKLDCLNTIIMIQSHELQISQIPKLKTTTLKSTLLGEYRDHEQTIYINHEYLCTSDPIKITNTILHEIRHVYQFAVVNSINWQDENTDSSYYKLAKDYKYAMDHYSTTNKITYHNNYLEVDARNYADVEILDYEPIIYK